MRENARRKLALQLQELVVRQRGAQKKYLQKLKDKEGGAGSAVFSFLEQEMGSAGGGADVDTGFNPAQLQVRCA